MRRIIIVIFALLAVAFVLFSLTELESIINVLRSSNPLVLLIAFSFEMLCILNTAATFASLYRVVGLRENAGRMLLMTTAANFVNMVAPSGGVGGIAIFMDETRRRSGPIGRVMAVGVLYLVYEYASLICVLAVGLGILAERGQLNTGEIIAAGLFLALALGVVGILILGQRSSGKLGAVLEKLARVINRLLRPILRRDVLVTENAREFSRDMAEGLGSIRGSKSSLSWPLLFTLNNKILQMCVLACAFWVINTPANIDKVVGGFSVSSLFYYISPTPSGVGFVEGILPSTLVTFGISLTEAILITLVYRAMTIWIPFAVGAVTFRILQTNAKNIANS